MNNDPISGKSSGVDDGIHSILSTSKDKAVECLEKWETCVRRHPVKAIAGAVLAGAVLHRLPLRSILIAKIRLASALAPPALLAYGAAKLCEILQQKGANAAAAKAAEHPRESMYQP